ncbi:MAG: GNAT family N-acetyltransferase [Armatimonadetes bacterium]|nr:GNAT family N-acetyltransferase [Armatimonadota bacterium]
MKDGLDTMTLEDFDGVSAVWEQVEMWPHIGEDRAWYEAALARNPGCGFVWRDAGRIVGAVIAGWDGFRGSIFHLAVLETHRNRGLGSALLAAAEQKLKEMGVFQLNIMVYEENGFAESLYYRRGYERSPVKVLRKRFSAEREGSGIC